MGNRQKYFIFNKRTDYTRGYLDGFECDDQGIYAAKDSYHKSVFISRILDSQEAAMEWHRLVLDNSNSSGVSVKISIYAGESTYAYWEDDIVNLEEVLRSKELSLEEKKNMMEPFLQKTMVDTQDILLHEVTGRFLWLIIELYRKTDEVVHLSNIKILFPKATWIEYLPEIYQEADESGHFLERFLGIFQTMYEDLNQQITEVADNFDTQSAKSEFLSWIASWIGVDNGYIWSEKQLRKFLPQAVSLYKRRGTRQGIIDFVSLYVGEKVYIVEYDQVRQFKESKEYYHQLVWLYGNDPFEFTLLVREEAVPTIQLQKSLGRIIDGIKPAELKVNLVILKSYIFLDGYSYLGINSRLGKLHAMELNDGIMLSMTALQ